ncbi:choice-of-anchor Q domain-containing protein [Dysgonomonas macrotermitis]|uniref:Right handed beta helix region n=1 Tax=Dysgonomonas macrotermitis TaxID=1346286 RepID=A0A1M5ILP9_9BACT|nr:choice-of-anchor Q domain-containing protein [Dysgonomonas macrotermitis]SHG29242.1 hypothetical protein SAMN05444362_12034 [Dysgonomonas macrotermitis]
MKAASYILILVVSLSMLFACDNDDKFTSDSNIRLSFSSDTVRFDTVFTGFGTATKRLKIYNKDKKAVTIDNIELMNAAKTGFRINVDGVSGDNISNVDILGKDSIYVFVEVTVDPLNQNSPLLIADSIRMRFNGVTQYVRLEAIGQDVVFWKAHKITENTTLSSDKPYLIYDSLRVEKGVKLTIDKNAILYFHNNARLSVQGTLDARGTVTEPIVFRGDRTDNMIESPVLPYDRVPGQWGGVHIASDSYDNVFENVRIRNGIYGIVFYPSDTIRQKATLFNTIVQNTTKEGLWAVNAKISAKNSLFANSATNAVKLLGGSYEFIHCTVANYMYGAFISLRQPAMVIGNSGTDMYGNSITAPLGKCLVANTIISGSLADNNLTFEQKENVAFEHLFVNCLLKVKGTDDVDFVNTIWNMDPVFKFIYSSETAADNPDKVYYFNYELTSQSPAINFASRVYSAGLPEDIRGVSRRSDDGPDIGCYEWVQ